MLERPVQIVIDVWDGGIQNVYSSEPLDTQVCIVDWDGSWEHLAERADRRQPPGRPVVQKYSVQALRFTGARKSMEILVGVFLADSFESLEWGKSSLAYLNSLFVSAPSGSEAMPMRPKPLAGGLPGVPALMRPLPTGDAMRLSLSFAMDNAAFDDAPCCEAARILRLIADCVEADGVLGTEIGQPYKIYDVNGNSVGIWQIDD